MKLILKLLVVLVCAALSVPGNGYARTEMVIKAAVAGSVADRDLDGVGDNHDNPLPSLIAAGYGSGLEGSQGTHRMQMEWDISGLTPDQVAGACVILYTSQGTVDRLDTFFYHGTADQDGILEDSDFQSPVEKIAGIRMPVTGSRGTEGEFRIEVTGLLRADLERGFHYFSLQGRIDAALEKGPDHERGLQVYTSAMQNLNQDIAPRLVIYLPYSGPGSFSYYLPYYSTLDNGWTGLGLANPDPTYVNHFTVEVFSADGTLLVSPPRREFLLARGQTAFSVAPGLDQSGWIRVSSSGKLSGLAFLGLTGTPAVMADIPFVSQLSGCLRIPHVAVTDNSEQWDTRVCICNPNLETAAVTLACIDRSGNELARLTDEIPGQNSRTYSLRTRFPELVPLTGQVVVRADHGVAAFALYHNLDGGRSYFAGINADPCDP